VHRRNPMPRTTTKRTIPLSRPLFTLVDLAATLPTDPLEAAINQADRLNLIDPETLEAGLDSIPPFRGRGKLRFHWPELGLALETDGLTYHRTPMQQLEDRTRDQQHTLAGRTQIRFANLQIRESAAEVAATLKPVIARLSEQRQERLFVDDVRS
jgi:hypothetical protein